MIGTVDDWDRALLWHYRAQLLRVIDGDTAVFLVDVGYGSRHEVHLRIAGLNAAELSDPGGIEASAKLREIVGKAAGWPLTNAGWPFRVISKQRETVVSEVRSFERFVGDLYVVQPDGTLKDVKELVQ